MRNAELGTRNERDSRALLVGRALGVRAHRSIRNPQSAIRNSFTLVELLVVVTIIAILTAVLGATLTRVRQATKSYMCKNKLKTVAFEFGLFADDYSHGDRGETDRRRLGGFYVQDFQEKLYRVDEFWELPASNSVTYTAAREPLICASGPQYLQRQAGFPCDSAVNPKQNVSLGFNMRLHLASLQQPVTGWWVLRDVRLTARVLERPSAPLAFDVDGAAADQRRRLPFYSAPPAGDPGRYGDGLFWFPALRHEREMNVGFVGGHVSASRRPLAEPGWDWKYQPPAED